MYLNNLIKLLILVLIITKKQVNYLSLDFYFTYLYSSLAMKSFQGTFLALVLEWNTGYIYIANDEPLGPPLVEDS